MRGNGLDGCGSGEEQVMGCCEHGNEALGSVKCAESLDKLRN
jgi:hypothetical protein